MDGMSCPGIDDSPRYLYTRTRNLSMLAETAHSTPVSIIGGQLSYP
jgi:hypothetical protein